MKYSPEELKELLEKAPTDEKGRPIISDEDFLDNLKELPNGTKSDAGKISNCGGYVSPLQKGTERAREIAKSGGEAAAETYLRRKTFKESITILLNKKDKDGISMQEKIVEAMANKAMDGCVGAFEALRDTVGEKPTDQVSLDVMTDKDREVLKNLTERLGLNDKS
jgi:hypothetical protein